jgi:hypothetical protein
LKAEKALYYLFSSIASLIRQVETKVELLRKNKDLILDTIEKVKPALGLKRILGAFGISHSKMYYWVEKRQCWKSIIQLCHKRHPNQLLPAEVSAIKEYLIDERFKNWSLLSVYYQALRDKAVLWAKAPGTNMPIA